MRLPLLILSPLLGTAQTRVELLRNLAFPGVPNKRDKITSGFLNPAFSRVQKRVELLRNPCILGGPQQRVQNQNWLPHPCFLGGPEEGGIAT